MSPSSNPSSSSRFSRTILVQRPEASFLPIHNAHRKPSPLQASNSHKMQLTTVFTLLTAAASVASAWEFTGYRDQNYRGGVVIYRSGNGLVNNLCVDIITNDNQMSSFKWYRGTNIGCSFKLFDGHGCKGTKIASSTGNWNVPAISAQNNDKASSLWVDCL